MPSQCELSCVVRRVDSLLPIGCENFQLDTAAEKYCMKLIQRRSTVDLIVASENRPCYKVLPQSQLPHARTGASVVGQPLMLRVRLVRKFAERLNGVDLSKFRVGDYLQLSLKEARLLVAEGWAELVDDHVEKKD